MCLIVPICFPCFLKFFNRLGFEIPEVKDEGPSGQSPTEHGVICCRKKMSCSFVKKNKVEDVSWRDNRKHKPQETQPSLPPPTLRVQGKQGSLSHPDNDKGNGKHTSKTCCFCWCCCCSCSCISIKDSEESQGRPSDDINNDPITYEEIQMWGKSFEKLLKNKRGQEVFRQFLRSEFSEENVLFWIACESLKYQTPADYVEEQARNIYEDYISIFSPKEVSLDSEVRELIDRNMVNPTRNTFDEAQIQIFTLMQRDSYLRFVSSNLYKQLLSSNQPTTSSNQQSTAVTGSAAISGTQLLITAMSSAEVATSAPASTVHISCVQSSTDTPKVFSNFGVDASAVKTASIINNVRVACNSANGSQTNTKLQVTISEQENQLLLKQDPPLRPTTPSSLKSSTRANNFSSTKTSNQGILTASSALEQLQQQNSVEINYLTLGPDPTTKPGFEPEDSRSDLATNGCFSIPVDATALGNLQTAIDT